MVFRDSMINNIFINVIGYNSVFHKGKIEIQFGQNDAKQTLTYNISLNACHIHIYIYRVTFFGTIFLRRRTMNHSMDVDG